MEDLARLETFEEAQESGSGQSENDVERDPNQRPFRPVHFLEGILAGYDFSPDALKEARRIMWPEPAEDWA